MGTRSIKKRQSPNKTRHAWKSNCRVMKSGCWEWKFGFGGDRYAIVTNPRTGRPEHASRMAYRLFKGPIKNHVLHTCDNRRCVRPKHLVDGTRSRNIKEAWARASTRHVWRASCSKSMAKMRASMTKKTKAYKRWHDGLKAGAFNRWRRYWQAKPRPHDTLKLIVWERKRIKYGIKRRLK